MASYSDRMCFDQCVINDPIQVSVTSNMEWGLERLMGKKAST